MLFMATIGVLWESHETEIHYVNKPQSFLNTEVGNTHNGKQGDYNRHTD